MKKTVSLLLALMLLLAFGVVAFADGSITLTTEVPAAATYTLSIPSSQAISYGATATDIGTVSVSECSGFTESKSIEVTITYSPFASDTITTIPYTIVPYGIAGTDEAPVAGAALQSGGMLVFKGRSTGGVYNAGVYDGNNTKVGNLDHLSINIKANDWSSALAGNYSSIINFTSEIVSAS